jgi:integrase
MASYSKRKTKKGEVWGVRFRVVENGKELHKHLSPFPTKKKAEEAYRAYMVSYKPNYEALDNSLATNFNVLVERYIKSKAHETKESTQYEYPNIFNRFIIPYFDGRNIETITKADLFIWQDTIWKLTHTKNGITKRYSFKYLSKIRGVFYNFMRYCGELHNMDNPFRYVKIPKNIEAPKVKQFWEISEFEEFIQTVDDMTYRTLFYFLFYTGVRIGEAQAIGEEDIDGLQVHICKTYTRKTTDGTRYKITGTKNYKNYKKDMPKVLRNVLDDYIVWKRQNNIPADFLFGGKEPIPETSLRRAFNKYMSTSKKRITPHGFRHSYVSMLIHIGCTTKTVAELIGDTEEQVIKTYSHLYRMDKHIAIAMLNNLVEKSNCTKIVPNN